MNQLGRARAGYFTTESTEFTEKNREEGLEEIARRYLLQPVGGFPPGFMWEEKMRFAYMRTSPTNLERREKRG